MKSSLIRRVGPGPKRRTGDTRLDTFLETPNGGIFGCGLIYCLVWPDGKTDSPAAKLVLKTLLEIGRQILQQQGDNRKNE